MSDDPTESNPDLYKVLFENERVRVLEYRDVPGNRTTPHSHPDSVMVTLSDFDRRLISGHRAARRVAQVRYGQLASSSDPRRRERRQHADTHDLRGAERSGTVRFAPRSRAGASVGSIRPPCASPPSVRGGLLPPGVVLLEVRHDRQSHSIQALEVT